MGHKASQIKGSDNMYPDPTISVDKAWDKMNILLRSERQIKRRARLSILATILLTVIIAIVQLNNSKDENKAAVTYSTQKLNHSNKFLNLIKINNFQGLIKHNIPLLSLFKNHSNLRNPNNYEVKQRRLSDSILNLKICSETSNIEKADFNDKNNFIFYLDSLHENSYKFRIIGIDQLKLKNRKLARELQKANFYVQIAIPFQNPMGTNSYSNFVTSFGIEKVINKNTAISFLIGINEKCLSNKNEITNQIIGRDTFGLVRPPIYQKVRIINTNGYSIACVAKQSIGKFSLGIGFRIVNNYSALLNKSDSMARRISDSSYSVNKKDNAWKYISAHCFQLMSQVSYTYKKFNLGAGLNLPLNSISRVNKDDKLLSSNVFIRYNFN